MKETRPGSTAYLLIAPLLYQQASKPKQPPPNNSRPQHLSLMFSNPISLCKRRDKETTAAEPQCLSLIRHWYLFLCLSVTYANSKTMMGGKIVGSKMPYQQNISSLYVNVPAFAFAPPPLECVHFILTLLSLITPGPCPSHTLQLLAAAFSLASFSALILASIFLLASKII